MFHRWKPMVFITGFILILIWGCGKKQNVLARIGNRFNITLEDFQENNRRFSKGTSYEEDLKILHDNLNEMIDSKLLLLGAYDAGYDQDSTVLVTRETSEKRYSMQQLYDKEIVNNSIKESEIRDYYAKSGKQVTLRTIFLEIHPSIDSVEVLLIRKDAESLLKKIKNGENYEFLASRHSQDRQTAIKGGLVGTLTYTKIGDPVQEAAFTMKEGEVSGIIESISGLNIIKVDKIEPLPQKPYSEMRDEIKGKLFQNKRDEISQKADQYWKDLKIEKKVTLNIANIDSLAAIMKTWDTFTTDSVLKGFASLPDSIRNRDLATYKGGRVAVPEFAAWIKMVMGGQIRNGITSPKTIESMMDNLVMSEILPVIARKKGLDKHPDVAANVRRAYESTMVQLFIEKDIWGTIEPAEEELQQYYNANLEEKYTPEKTYRIQEVVVETEDLALEVARRARSGQNFNSLVEKLSIKPGKARNNGIEEFRQRRKYQHAAAADSMKVGEISDPIQLSETRYSVFKFLGINQQDPRPYEQVRGRVLINLTNDIKNEKKTQWLDEKRASTPIAIDDNALKAFLATYYTEESNAL